MSESAEEFFAEYAARSGLTVEELYAIGRVVVTCGPEHRCSDPGCPGFAVVSIRAFEEDREFYGWRLILPDNTHRWRET